MRVLFIFCFYAYIDTLYSGKNVSILNFEYFFSRKLELVDIYASKKS